MSYELKINKFRGFKSPGSVTDKFCIGVKISITKLNYELRITNYELF